MQRAWRKPVDHDDVRLCEQLPSPGRDEPGITRATADERDGAVAGAASAKRKRSGFELCLQGITDRDDAVRIAATGDGHQHIADTGDGRRPRTRPLGVVGAHAPHTQAVSRRRDGIVGQLIAGRRVDQPCAVEVAVGVGPWVPQGAAVGDQLGERLAQVRRHDLDVGARLHERQRPPCRDRSAADNDDAPAGDVEHERVRRLAHQ